MTPEERDPKRCRVILTREEVPVEPVLLRSAGALGDAPPEPDLHFSGEEISAVDGAPFTVEFTMPAEVFAKLGSPEEVVLHVRHRLRQGLPVRTRPER